MFRKYLYGFIILLLSTPVFAVANPMPQEILHFKTMYAVDGAFLTPDGATVPNVRDVVGDYQAWKINKFIKGHLFSDGRLIVKVRGLVFPNAPNDEYYFRALVSCLTNNNGFIATQNVISDSVWTNPAGNADFNQQLQLPSPCVAPVVMILNGDSTEGNVWFAISGF
ncbi:MAG: hypothetical protein WAX77_10980 [Methylococcaceae bacterium]